MGAEAAALIGSLGLAYSGICPLGRWNGGTEIVGRGGGGGGFATSISFFGSSVFRGALVAAKISGRSYWVDTADAGVSGFSGFFFGPELAAYTITPAPPRRPT